MVLKKCYMIITDSNKNMYLLPSGVVVCTKRCYKNIKMVNRCNDPAVGILDLPLDFDGKLGETGPKHPQVSCTGGLKKVSTLSFVVRIIKAQPKRFAEKLSILCNIVSLCNRTTKGVLIKITNLEKE